MVEGESRLKHRVLTEQIIGVFYEVYNELGHGFSSPFTRNHLSLL
jgi:hypothetical protein